MKRVIIILLLIVFTYSFLGAGFVYNIWLFSVKENVEQRVKASDHDSRKIIKVPKSWQDNPPNDFKWHEEHEFQYRGQMYDIIRKEVHGDQVWYYCYWDKAETELINNLSEYVSNYLQQKPEEAKTKSYLKIIIEKIFLLPFADVNFDLSLHELASNFIPVQPHSIYLDVDLPPPRESLNF